ncbi:alpha/beta hydrolase [Brachybacterium hainanense]|uniref:Alpha/beta hydrolase n=1 Tax=Brachybacterium hainanense TaxID=1541174 RepID=A0ABV6RCI5_9MICO
MHHESIQVRAGRDDVTVTTYVLEDSPELLAGRRRPAVLVLPGGAYIGCSDREGEPVALAFAALGYHAFVLRYSVHGDWGFLDGGRIERRERSIHPAPLHDVAAAMGIIRDRAEEWLVDADRIAVAGFSAGGHNAAMYGTRWDDRAVVEAAGGTPVRPAALVLGYPMTDYPLLHEAPAPGDGGAPRTHDAASMALFGRTDPSDSLLREVSPALHVTAATPPAFLWHTAADALVPVEQSLSFARALARQGIPFELHVFEGGDHDLSLATQATARLDSQIVPPAAAWTRLAAAWLQTRLSLPVPSAQGA